MTKFKVYYSDGSTYEGEPFDAPPMHVALILEKDKDHGRRIVSLTDFYVWRLGRWFGTDMPGFYQYLMTPGEAKYVLFGEMMLQDDWNAINGVAQEDPDFPVRTAYHANEPRER